jgi:tetratricopeptide (TPR) repeat protein
MGSNLRKSLMVLRIALPIAALVPLVSFGQTTPGIAGKVLGVDGKPVNGAQIKIDRIDIKGSYKVKTNRNGEYRYANLPIGQYNVTLEVEGKDVDAIGPVRTGGPNPDPIQINFDMKAIAARNADPAAAAAAAAAQQANRGMSEAEKAEYEKKMKELEQAKAKNAELNAAFNAGKEASAANNWNGAVDGFEKASTIDPSQHVVWSNLGEAYLGRAKGKTGAEQTADVEKAVSAYSKAIEIKPDDPAYHNNYALALAQGKKFEQAEQELTKAAQLDPPSAGKYYYNLGAVYVNTGQNDPAGAAFQKAIAADPNYADAYYQYGLVLFAKATTGADGKITPPAGTAEAFQKYLQLRPDGPNAEPAKAMLAAIGSTVETQFQQPGQKKQAPKKK